MPGLLPVRFPGPLAEPAVSLRSSCLVAHALSCWYLLRLAMWPCALRVVIEYGSIRAGAESSAINYEPNYYVSRRGAPSIER